MFITDDSTVIASPSLEWREMDSREEAGPRPGRELGV